jgi:uncharacterized membrane protein
MVDVRRDVRSAARAALMVLCMALFASAATARAGEAVVRAVLFVSPECRFCLKVTTLTLPPLAQKYGSQLQIAEIDVSTPDGSALFDIAMKQYQVARPGVPALIVGDKVLIGANDIPEQLPGLIETHLARGGAGWPDLPGLAPFLPAGTTIFPAQPDLATRLARDPLGNGAAIAVFAIMVLTLAISAWRFVRVAPANARQFPEWLLPALAVLGVALTGYLVTLAVGGGNTAASCSAGGGCGEVQQSEYARVAGIPVSAIGLAGYAAAGLLWIARRNVVAALALFGAAMIGTAFAAYLTFLEPFVIGASCARCLAGTLPMIALLWLSVAPAKAALASLAGA